MRNILWSLFAAFSTYSKLPCPHVSFDDGQLKYSLCFFPMVGLVIGGLTALWFLICHRLGVRPFFVGTVACLIPLVVTGGIHMDGYMDTTDALVSWQTREKRLMILKDSHTGAFAVMGCCGYLMLHAAILSEVRNPQTGWMICVGYVLSRALSAVNLLTMPSARPDGMAAGLVRRSGRIKGFLIFVSVVCGIFMVFLGKWMGVAVLATGMAVLGLFRKMAVRYFGGITGDLAGFFVQVFEIVTALASVFAEMVL